MSHHIIIDGYNLLLRGFRCKLDDDSQLSEARQRLIQRLENYRLNKKIRMTVVFDGTVGCPTPSTRETSGVRILYSRPPNNADRLIIQILEKESSIRDTTLVTSDQALAALARSMGSTHWNVELFMDKLSSGKTEARYEDKYDPPQSPKEIEEWLKLFGSEEG
jgi:predicted RNA-binding protein with PIN domain